MEQKKRIKMRTRYAGPAGLCQPGKCIDLPVAVAKELIAGGYAMAMVIPKSVAVVAEEEGTFSEKRGRSRRRTKL